MPFNGNGTYNLPAPAYPAIPDTVITAEDRNTIDEDIASALSNAVTRDGQSPLLADIDLGGHKIKNGQLDTTITATTLPLGTNTTQVATMAALYSAMYAAVLPAPTGLNTEYSITTDGTLIFWQHTFPTGGNPGMVLATDGTTRSWVPGLPDFILQNAGVL